jgi:predicted HTH transcriptional regulator
LDGQLIPENEALWSVDQYESFLSARRRLLSEHLNTYLNGLATEVEADYGSVSIEELISEGESGNLEFKSSLRWDYRQGCVNKKLESVIVKTVAAFANSEGGALLIGVDDDGNILGLDNDCASLKGGDIDYFEIHVRNLLNQGMGTAFVASSVKFVFPTIGDKEVCQIDVGSSADPIMLAVNDGGKNVQKFYVRSGNTSQELSMTEFNSYQKGRFGQ